MGLFSRLSKRETVLETNPGPRQTSKPGASFRKKIEKTYNPEQALRIGAVYRAAQIRSDSMAMVRLRYMMYDRQGRCFVEVRDLKTKRPSLLNYTLQVKPNSRQNAFQFWKTVEMMRIFNGSCCILPRYDMNGEWSELVPCSSVWDPYANTYTLTNTMFNINGLQVDADRVIVVRGIVTLEHPNGESIIHYAARTTSLNATSEELALENAGKGGRQKIIIQQKDNDGFNGLGGLDHEEMEKQAQALQNAIYTDDVVYDHSFSSITPINMNAVDMQLLDTRKFSIADIARFFGVPRTLLMDDSNTNYNSTETAIMLLKNGTLAPLMREIEDEFNSKLLGFNDFGTYKFQFDTSGLMSLDLKTQNDCNKGRLETGLASVNELRAEANMPYVQGGDDYYVSCNVAPVGSVKLSGGSATGKEGGDE